MHGYLLTRAQGRADDSLTPIPNIYDKFVAACGAYYTPGTFCTVDETLHGFREMFISSNTYQINRVKTALMHMFWLKTKPSTWFLPKFTLGLALMHRDCHSQPKLFWISFRQLREQAETLPLTIFTRQFLCPWS